eukprot:gene14529-biopygen11159
MHDVVQGPQRPSCFGTDYCIFGQHGNAQAGKTPRRRRGVIAPARRRAAGAAAGGEKAAPQAPPKQEQGD